MRPILVRLLKATHFFILLNSILVVVMDEGNSVAKNGVEGSISYVEKNNLGTVTTKHFLELEHGEPSQATEKCILFLNF